MAETVSNAVATRDDGAGQLVARYQDDFAKVLPRSVMTPETFVRLTQGVLRRNRNLEQAAKSNPGAFLGALLDAARLGHEPGSDEYYLIPRGGAIEGEEGYRGIIQRILRATPEAIVTAEVVFDSDEFSYTPGVDTRPTHKVDWFGSAPRDLEHAVGVYAYVTYPDEETGDRVSRVVVMSRAQVMEHKAQATTKKIWDGPNWRSMWLKCPVRELSKWVATSNEHRAPVKQPATVEFVAPEPIQAEATVLNQDSPGGQGRTDAQQSSAAGGDNPLHYEEDTE
jgi:recombination protein RecT